MKDNPEVWLEMESVFELMDYQLRKVVFKAIREKYNDSL